MARIPNAAPPLLLPQPLPLAQWRPGTPGSAQAE
eukprot:CAMPEP_0180784632 /NCGR_PEP_ID=MMETSP1038_2-20121128/49716_1 /TAXON_ID=632150 /ORGANISM="Azadinium spinosum, Strain 3D9" /LENGTH=33 /DNA_ID= /DNA_START= /DNA_END= /DNA_ORIENTATION=